MTMSLHMRCVWLAALLLALLQSSVHAAGISGQLPSRTVDLPSHAVAIVVDDSTHHVFVASLVHMDDFGNATGSGTVSMLDARDGKILHSATIAQAAQAMAVDSRAGRVYVYCLGRIDTYKQSKGSGIVEVLSATTGEVVGTTEVGGGDANLWPQLAMAVDTVTAHLFVADLKDSAVTMLDASSGKVLHLETVGNRPDQIAVDQRAGRAFVINDGDNTMSVLNTRTGKSVATVPLGKNPSTVATDAQRGRIFVGNLGFDKKGNTVNGQVLLFDAKTLKRLGVSIVGKEPYSLAVDSRSGHVFVVNRSSNSVSMLDGQTGRLLHLTKAGTDPIYVAVDARAGRAYVASEVSGATVFDTSTGAQVSTIGADVSGLIAVSEGTGKVFVTGASGITTLTIAPAQ